MADTDKPDPLNVERRVNPEVDSHPGRVPDRRARAHGMARGDRVPPYQRSNDTPLALAGRVLSSRWRTLRDRFSRDFMRRTLNIGVSARIFHP